MKQLILCLLLICVNHLFAQNYLEIDTNKIINPNLINGIPTELKDNFKNFKDGVTFENIEGLTKKKYVTTNAPLSYITIEKNNIGRVVLYVKLFNSQDTRLFNPLNNNREGKITLIPYRGDKILKKIVLQIDFKEDIYQQIHFNSYQSEIDKIQIEFETENDLFIIEKLKIIPYTDFGNNYYKAIENSVTEILDLSNNIENESLKIKELYQTQLTKIQQPYSTLSSLIIGNTFENIAIVQANSLNPFKNDKFKNHYNSILEKASVAEKAKIDNLINDLENNDFSKIALTLDNLFLGGKFATVINLIDGLFKTNINLTSSDSKPMPIVNFSKKYYLKNEWSKERLKLIPIKDEKVLNEIKILTDKNEAFKQYISDISNFLKIDIETHIELNKNILVAKIIRSDLEVLIWDILNRFTDEEKSFFIKKTGVNFVGIGTELEKNFDPSIISKISELKQLRNESILSITKINELMHKYDAITSKIKTYYDLIYEIRPKERKKHFNKLENLPANLVVDWKDRQDSIIDEYTKDNGLKQFLSTATGKE